MPISRSSEAAHAGVGGDTVDARGCTDLESAAKDLQGDLLDATDVETILVAVEDASEIFNKVNVSTAVHRVARLVRAPVFDRCTACR